MTSADDLALLVGPQAHDLLAAAVASAGGRLESSRLRQVDHQPGGHVVAAYRAHVRWADADRVETLGASTDAADAGAPGVVTVDEGDTQVHVWRFPADPALPALDAATDATAVVGLLASFGVEGLDPSAVVIKVRSYRPRRRAVLEVRHGERRLFVKVLHPAEVRDLHWRHTLLADAGLPTPRSLGWSEQGLLVLGPVSGQPMRRALWDPAGQLPSPSELTGLLDQLPAGVLDLPRRSAWSDSVRHYAGVVGAALPEQADRAAAAARRIRSLLHDAPDVPTHGDFYDAQLLLTDGRVTGLLDVDSLGPGRRNDDLACLVAHVDVLGAMVADHRERLSGLARHLAVELGRDVDEADLAARVAGVMLSLATGPHRVQQAGWQAATVRRLDLVDDWVRRAESV